MEIAIIQVESELAAVRKRIEERGDAADKAEHLALTHSQYKDCRANPASGHSSYDRVF
jgi:hypothetical protein